jgi:hypothetical protein
LNHIYIVCATARDIKQIKIRRIPSMSIYRVGGKPGKVQPLDILGSKKIKIEK